MISHHVAVHVGAEELTVDGAAQRLVVVVEVRGVCPGGGSRHLECDSDGRPDRDGGDKPSSHRGSAALRDVGPVGHHPLIGTTAGRCEFTVRPIATG